MGSSLKPIELTGSAALPEELDGVDGGLAFDPIVISVPGALATDTATLNIPAPAVGKPLLMSYYCGTDTVTVLFCAEAGESSTYWPDNSVITASINR